MDGKRVLFGFMFKELNSYFRPPQISFSSSRWQLATPLRLLQSSKTNGTDITLRLTRSRATSDILIKSLSTSYRLEQGSFFPPCRNLSYEMHSNSDIDSRSAPSFYTLKDMSGILIFKDDNIIAVNKPYGLSVYGSSQSTSKTQQQQNPSLTDMMQNLKDEPELNVGLSLKSFYSGVVLLTQDKDSKEKLDKFLSMAGSQKLQFMTYLAITVGVPHCPHGIDMEANIKREFLHDREMSVVCDKSISSARKEGSMIQTIFNVKPLLFNKDTGTSLVQVSISKDKWEAVEVLLSHYLSPVIGDKIYSNRTHTLMGVPFAACPHAAIPGRQILPLPIQKALSSSGISSLDQPLPLCVHRYKVALSRFPSKNSNPLIIKASPDELFVNILKCLGLYNESMFST